MTIGKKIAKNLKNLIPYLSDIELDIVETVALKFALQNKDYQKWLKDKSSTVSSILKEEKMKQEEVLTDENFTFKKIKTFEDLESEIIEHFNFVRVHRCMEFLQWHWQNDHETPSIVKLINTAKNLLKRVYEEEIQVISTGGFIASYDKKENYLQLQFVIADWYATDDEE